MEEPLGPLDPPVVFGPASLAYDFGPSHPLTPRRFGPGIDLLRRVGASQVLPPPVADAQAIERVHRPAYVSAVRRLSEAPGEAPEIGFSAWGDDPPFRGMHEAAATVAGGSLVAMQRILGGEHKRVLHPGGGLHHAMPGSASGFCIYNDVALAIALARDAGHHVLYVDLDVHHGDGVQAAFWDDPAVMTISFHETGEALFPGSGFPDELGGLHALGSAVNVPLRPGTGDASWTAAVRTVVPPLADVFRPTMLVSQHGCDTHALDPLAHLQLTTTSMSAAARLLGEISDRYTGGRWLATGGGGYDAFRVVPRSWSLVWLAQARRPVPGSIPEPWRSAWAGEAAARGQSPLPRRFLDEPGLVGPEEPEVARLNAMAAEDVLGKVLALLP